MFTIKKNNNVDIVVTGSGVIGFAAEECKRYLEAMTGCACTVRQDGCKSAGGPCRTIRIGAGAEFLAAQGMPETKWDGFAVRAAENELTIAASAPRGALYGVYSVLREAGCRFIKAANVGEYVPKGDFAVENDYVKNPSFRVRGLTLAVTEYNEDWCAEAVAFVDWCAKNYINTVFLHESLDFKLDSYNAQIIAEIKKRGMSLEFGGHGAQDFVPKDLFEKQPERFIQKNGKRTKEGNFCVSDERNISELCSRASAMAAEGVDLLHLWFEDTLGGSWCNCEKCSALSPAEQMEKCIRSVAGSIREGTEVGFLFYHDTLENISSLTPPKDNMVAFYCPRERCYAHSLNDEGCALNRRYDGFLKELIGLYGADRVEIFDYYMDYILFNKVKALIPETIAGDLAYYRSLGIERVCPLSFGNYSFWAYDLNFYVYVRHVFDADADIRETVASYLKDFGFGEEYGGYISLMCDYTKNYFSFCGYPGGYYDIRGLELCEYFGEHIRKIDQALRILKKAKEVLENYRPPVSLQAYYQDEKTLLGLTMLEAEAILKRMRARFENYKENPKDKGKIAQELEDIKPMLYKMIEIIGKVPLSVKGVAGRASFVEGLCKTQIWTLNELMKLELGLDVSLEKIQ